jgi:hypothetical protein
VLESTNHMHEYIIVGHNIKSANYKCESIPKPPYLSGIVTYEDEKTAIFHSNLTQIHFQVSKYFVLPSSPPTAMMTPQGASS